MLGLIFQVGLILGETWYFRTEVLLHDGLCTQLPLRKDFDLLTAAQAQRASQSRVVLQVPSLALY